MAGLSQHLAGLSQPLKGCSWPLRGLNHPFRGLSQPLRGFSHPLGGLSQPPKPSPSLQEDGLSHTYRFPLSSTGLCPPLGLKPCSNLIHISGDLMSLSKVFFRPSFDPQATLRGPKIISFSDNQIGLTNDLLSLSSAIRGPKRHHLRA